MTGDRDPLVSVVVAAWNAETTIADTLRSALAQTWRKLEVIVIDDGSTDSTAAIARRFAEQDSRLRVESIANSGPAAARNRAIAMARGAFVAPLDADDLWNPAKIERQLAAALAAPEPPGFVYAWFHLVDAAGNVTGTCGRHRCEGRAVRQLAFKNLVGNGSSALFSRSALVEAGGYPEGLDTGEDHLLQLRVARRHPVVLVPEHLVGYRKLPGSRSADPLEVFEGYMRVERIFRDECGAVPDRTWRWVRGARYLALANAQRRWAPYFGWLARAALRDPPRVLAHLLDRGLRHGRRVLRPPRAVARPAPFDAFSEADEVPRDPYESAIGRAALRRLDERRLAWLARLDSAGEA